MASEVVRGYNRKFNSPKCIFKMDLRKAYDSIDWEFLGDVLREMNFPVRIIEWILGFVKTISYFVLMNGRLMRPFKATKGLRQGDPLSPTSLPWEWITYSGY